MIASRVDYELLDNQDPYWGSCIVRDFASSDLAVSLSVNFNKLKENPDFYASNIKEDSDRDYLKAVSRVLSEDLRGALYFFLRSKLVNGSNLRVQAAIAILAALARDGARALECGVSCLRGGHELANNLIELCILQACDEFGFQFSSPRIIYPFPITNNYIRKHDENLEYPEQGRELRVITFLACDSGYFSRFGKACVASVLQFDREIHLHVYNPTTEDVTILAKLCEKYRGFHYSFSAVSSQNSNAVFYSIDRFLKWKEISKDYQDASWVLVDADTLFNRDPGSIFTGSEKKVFLSIDPRAPLFCRNSAAFLAFRSSYESSIFSDLYTEYLAVSLRLGKYRWFTDQIGLYLTKVNFCSHEDLAQDLIEISCSSVCDLECKPSSFLWAVSNNKNFAPFVRRLNELILKL